MTGGPRCLHPVAYRARNDPGTGLAAVCWRPAGHPGIRHASKAAYLRDLARKSAVKRAARQERRRSGPVLSDPPATVAVMAPGDDDDTAQDRLYRVA